jgi:hypothetical protein
MSESSPQQYLPGGKITSLRVKDMQFFPGLSENLKSLSREQIVDTVTPDELIMIAVA